MKTLLGAALLCAALSANAAPVARHPNGDTAQLLETACPAAVTAMVPESLRPQYRAAVVVASGQRYVACWMAVPARGFVHLVFADGDQGIVPMGEFHDEPGI
jgi:hypothetical protein